MAHCGNLDFDAGFIHSINMLEALRFTGNDKQKHKIMSCSDVEAKTVSADAFFQQFSYDCTTKSGDKNLHRDI